ncbi:MAG: MAPEG family protein [Oceanococcaceae bacterium]
MPADIFADYGFTLVALGLSAGLFLVQLLVADLAGIRAGHKPGNAIPADGRFLFRASRAHANLNESFSAFIALVIFGVAIGASATGLNAGAGLYLLGRVAHMLCYYAGWHLLRSVAFGVSLLGLFVMLSVGLLAI